MSESINNAIYISLIGSLVVFGTLSILIGVITCFKYIDILFSRKFITNNNDKIKDIDEKKIILISAAIGAYFESNKSVKINSITILPLEPRESKSWLGLMRGVIHSSHSIKK